MLYQLVKKEAKGPKLCTNIKWDLEGKKSVKLFFRLIDRQNLQNQTISDLYTDDNKSNYSSNPKDIFNSAKRIYEKLSATETTSEAVSTKFLSKVSDIKKISDVQFNLSEVKIYLDEIIKSVNFQTSHKHPGNNDLTAEFYKHYSPAVLDVYDSWRMFVTMGFNKM